ncbi:MAG: DUF5686 family protein [Chitinophagales bacterium]
MSLRKFLSSAILLLIATSVWSQQTIVKGRIVDEETNEGLAFATAIFTGTTVGVTTDLDGYFEMTTNDQELKSITLSYVGYEPKEAKINPGKINEKEYKLKAVKLELDVVEVKAKRRVPKDTAAIELFRNVVANKYRNDPSSYEYLSYKQYAKTEFGFYDVSEKFKDSKLVKRFSFMLDNMDTTENGIEVLPVLLKETSEQIYYQKNPQKKKEILLGDRFSGVDNFSVADLVDYNYEDIQIYGNLIRVNGKPFMSPFADNARFSYKYFLTDTAQFDGLTCFRLDFTGRGNADASFSGYAWIHDSTFAIQSIRLIVLPNAGLNFVSDFVVQQDFKLINGEHWIKDYEFLQTEYNLFKKKNKEKQSFLVRKTNKRTDITINEPIDPKLLDGEERIIQEGARDRGADFWDTTRVDSLQPHEVGIFKTIDSIQNSKFYKTIRWFTYLGTSGWMDAKYLEFGKIYEIYSWNAVEGKRIKMGVRTRYHLSDKIQFSGHVAYGTKDKLWKYGIESRLHLKRQNEKWHMLGLRYSYDMSTIADYNPILRPNPPKYDNIALSLLRADPLDDLFLLRHAQVWYEKEWLRGFNTRLQFDHKINFSVPTGTSFTTSDGAGDTTVIEKFTTSDLTLNFVWAKGLKFFDSNFGRFPIVSHKPIFIFDYTTGIKGLFKADQTYHKLHFGVEQRLLGPIGYTVYRAHAGILFSKSGVPYPLLTIHEGNESFLYNKYAFNALNESEFVSDKYASISVVHHFDGFIFNKIPGISKLQLRSLLIYRAIYGHLDAKNANFYDLPGQTKALNDFYMEAGFGLENILKVLRVDMLFRITQRGQPDVNKWAIRFAIAPNF